MLNYSYPDPDPDPDPGPRTPDPGPRTPDPGPQIPDPRSMHPAPRTLLLLVLSLLPQLAAADEIAEATRRVEQIRQLTFTGPVARQTIDRSELRPYLTRQLVFGAGLTREDYERLLRALKLIDDRPEPIERLLDLYEAQVLAFYDPATHKYVQLSEPPPDLTLSAVMEKSVVVHEMVHALQDQRFDAGARFERIKSDWDASLAYLALLEGEATLVMMADLAEAMGSSIDAVAGNDDLLKALSSAAALDLGVSSQAPRYFVESLKFPYVAGTRYVAELYRRGGWSLVNAVHRNLPRTTRQILHPGEPAPDTKQRVRFRRPRARGSRLLAEMELGEFHWSVLVGEESAADLRRDRVHVIEDRQGRPTAFTETVWQTPVSARKFAETYPAFLRSQGEEPVAWVEGCRARVAYGTDRKAIGRFIGRR